MSAIAKPNPPATGAQPTPAPAEKPLKIPSLKAITTGGVGEEPVVTPPAVTPPAPTPAPIVTPVAPAAGEEEVIPTDIVTPAGKTPAQFAQERRLEKQTRLSTDELQTQYAQATTQLQETKAELDKIKAERDRIAQERQDLERLATTREGEINQFREQWATTHQVTFNPGEDEIVRTSDQTMKLQMQQLLPLHVEGRQTDGEGKPVLERVFAENILNDPAEQQRLHGVLAHYANARHNRNNTGIDMAVNMMAQILGANVRIEGEDQTKWQTLPRGNETFRAIEAAMSAALPSFQQKIGRMAEIQKQGPQLAVEAFGKRADQIRGSLSTGIFLDNVQIQRRLQADPQDPVALFAAIVSQAPDLKTKAEAMLGRFANSFATVGDKLHVPTLKGNTPQDVQAHMQEVQSHRAQLSDIMRYAVVGANVGPIIAQLIAERDAAEERAGRAASNENPGSPSSVGGMGSPAGGAEDIPTRIVT